MKYDSKPAVIPREKSLVIEYNGQEDVIKQILVHCDGKKTIQQIINLLPGINPNIIFTCIANLEQQGVVRDYGPNLVPRFPKRKCLREP